MQQRYSLVLPSIRDALPLDDYSARVLPDTCDHHVRPGGRRYGNCSGCWERWGGMSGTDLKYGRLVQLGPRTPFNSIFCSERFGVSSTYWLLDTNAPLQALLECPTNGCCHKSWLEEFQGPGTTFCYGAFSSWRLPGSQKRYLRLCFHQHASGGGTAATSDRAFENECSAKARVGLMMEGIGDVYSAHSSVQT